jgi:hypothetical protein
MRRTALPAAVALLGLVLTASACTSDEGNRPAAGPSAEPTAPSPVLVTAGSPPPPGGTGEPVVGITTLPPVPAGQPAPFGNGLVANVTHVDELMLEARGPGEVAGPGVGVTVELTNESADPVDLDGVVVNAYYGAGIPASASDTAPAAAATGALPPGETRRGVYVFQIPHDDAASLVVEVNYNGSPNVVLIRRR